MDLETYLKFPLKIHAQSPVSVEDSCANSSIMRLQVAEFHTPSIASHSTVAGGVGFLTGMSFFFYGRCCFFCGRYAQKRIASCSMLDRLSPRRIIRRRNFHRDSSRKKKGKQTAASSGFVRGQDQRSGGGGEQRSPACCFFQ